MTYGPKDFFDTLAETNWSDQFESFSAEERERLRLYSSLAYDLGQEDFHQEPLELSVRASPEESYQRLEHAGRTQLRSMAMVFRQLWMQGEPARFNDMRNLLRRRAAPGASDVLTMLDLLGARYKAAAREVMMKNVWADDPMGEPISVVRAEQVIDDWLYSGPFHTDAEKVERVRAWSAVPYEYSLAKSILGVAAVMWEMDLIVQDAHGEPVALAASA